MADEEKIKLAITHPGIVVRKAKKIVRAFLNPDYYLGQGYSLPPMTINFNLTYRCNLRCKMCRQYGEKGVYRQNPPNPEAELMYLELKDIIDDVSPFKPDIYITGGEPFLHKDILEFVKYIKTRGLLCNINTNGTFLAKNASSIIESDVDSLIVSLDGPKEVHDQIRGLAGTFEKAVAGIKELNRLKKERKKNKPLIKTTFTISCNNYVYLKEIIEIASNIGINHIDLGFSWFTTEKIGKRHCQVFEKLFSIQPDSWKGFVTDVSGIDLCYLKEEVRKIRKSRHPLSISFFPNIKTEEIPDYYLHPEATFGRKRCVVPYMMTTICPDGSLTPCADFPDYVVGNVKEERLSKLWNSKRYRYFRKGLKKVRLFPICSRCCGLYTYF